MLIAESSYRDISEAIYRDSIVLWLAMWFPPPSGQYRHLTAGASWRSPYKTHTHTLLFRWQYVFYFLDFKGLLFTNKINKKKDQKDFLTNTVCLHIVVRKFTFIFLPSVSSNQLSSFFSLQALGYMNELNNDHVSGVTEDRAARRHHRRRFRPSPTVFTTHIIGKHIKTVVATTK